MRKPQFGFRIEPELKEAIEKAAKKEKTSVSWMTNRLLEKGLEKKLKESKAAA